MGFVFIIYQVLLLLFGTVLGTSFGPDQYLEPFEFPKARRLAAANSPLDLKARTDLETVVLARKATFDFIHEPPEDGKEHEFAATAEVESQWPIFALERLDSDLNEVTCSDTQMQLFLNSLDRSKAIMQELEGISDFIIVTSHEGCDVEGERSIHKATNTAFDPERLVLSLDKAKCDWHDAFHSTQVSFSHRHLSRIQKRAYTFNKRQETDEPTTTKRVEGPTPDITIPTMSFSTTRLAPTATKALTQRYIDKKIFPPDFPAADLVIPQGVEVSCKNCTLQGYIEISKGSFNISGNGIKDAIAFFDHGSVDIVAKSLFSHIELGLDLSPSQALASLNMSLPTIPLTPFEIPGVVAFGPLIQPRFRLSVSLVEKIGFSYGFNLSVPDNSTIKINMDQFKNSSISGFGDTIFHALPFESTAALASLIFSVTFTPQILLGVSTAKGKVSGGIGAYIDLPKITVNASQLSHVNERCEPVPGKQHKRGDLTSAIDDIFDSLTHIAPSVDVNMGVLANLKANIANFEERATIQTVLASKSYPLPTTCLQFNRDRRDYTAPSHTTSAMTSPSSSQGAESASQDSKESGAGKPRSGLILTLLCCCLIAYWG